MEEGERKKGEKVFFFFVFAFIIIDVIVFVDQSAFTHGSLFCFLWKKR